MAEISYTILRHDLCPQLAELIEICFPDMPPEDQYDQGELEEMAEVFAAGTIVALDGDKTVGMGTGIFTNVDFDHMPPTENDLLYTNDSSNHDDDGDFYYGSDMMVHPDYRGRGIGRQIYDRRKGLVLNNAKKGFVAAAVLPGYAEYKHQIDIHTYLGMVIKGEVFDPTLSMQMRNGFKVIRPLHNYFIYPKSDNWSALIYWENPEYSTKWTANSEQQPVNSKQ